MGGEMDLVSKVKELAKKVYEELGGFGYINEKEYEHALAYELKENGLKYLQQVQVDLMYKDKFLKHGVVDLIVFDEKEEEAILVELKATKSEMESDAVDQIYKYYNAVKSSPTFPRIIADKVKCGLVINWFSPTAQRKMFKSQVEQEEEEIKFDLEKWKQELQDFKIIEIRMEKKKGQK